jgi:hypothetical protein
MFRTRGCKPLKKVSKSMKLKTTQQNYGNMSTNHPIYMFKKAPSCNINYSKNNMSSKYFTYLNKNTEIGNLLDATFHNIPYLKFSLLQEMA